MMKTNANLARTIAATMQSVKILLALTSAFVSMDSTETDGPAMMTMNATTKRITVAVNTHFVLTSLALTTALASLDYMAKDCRAKT